MFCPKCGVETPEGHKFCKACGTNLQIVSDAIEGGEDTLGQLRVDLDGLKKALSESGKAIGGEVSRAVRSAKYARRLRRRDRSHWGHWDNSWNWNQESDDAATQEPERPPTTEALTGPGPSGLPRGFPRPKDWLQYSKQRNVRDGLVSLFSGLGFGAFLYYIGRVIVDSGSINGIVESTHVHDLDKFLYAILPWLWLWAAPIVLKGLAQLLYGFIFAEPISSIAGAFGAAWHSNLAGRPQIASPPVEVAAPNQEKEKVPTYSPGSYTTGTVPSQPSVTENTTNILEKA
ncbi:MAG TPA: zinc ribbon domain-containing protein [Blastocatellia bacterium]